LTPSTSNNTQEPSCSGRRQGHWFVALMALLVVLYAMGLNGHWRIQRDSALYLGIARSLAEGKGYVFNYKPDVLAMPGFPTMMAAVYAAFGENFLVMNAVVSLMGLACVVFAYLLLRDMGAAPGVLMASVLMFGLSRQLYYYSAHLLTDVPFTMFSLAALWAGVRMARSDGSKFWTWCVASGVLSVCAMSLRPFGLALPPALAAALWLRPDWRTRRRRNLMACILIGIIFTVPLVLWVSRCAAVYQPGDVTYANAFRQRGFGRFVLHIAEQVPKLLDSLGESVAGVGISMAGGLLLAVLAAIGLVHIAREGHWIVPVFMAIYTGGAMLGNPGRRYLLPELALIVYAIVLGVQATADAITKSSRARHTLLVFLLVFLILLNAGRTGKIVVENRSRHFYQTLEGGQWRPYFQVSDWVKANTAEDSVIAAYEARLIHYLTKRRVVELPRDESALSVLQMEELVLHKGIGYVVLDADKRSCTRAFESLGRENPGFAQVVFRSERLAILRIDSRTLKQ
jgi:hypothetical protein